MLFLAAPCGRWGAYVTRSSRVAALCVAAGLALAAILSAGLYRAEFSSSVDEQWVLQGSVLTKNRRDFNSLFGGLPRNLAVVVSSSPSSSSSASAISKKHISALLDASTTLLATKNITSSSAQHSVPASDLCVRPSVPTLFKPTGPEGYGIGRTILSWGYAYISRCLSNATLIPASIDPLPETWGIDEFPCERTTVLDCFREGNFDYPAALRSIDESGLAVAMRDAAEKNSTAYQNCSSGLKTLYGALFGFAYPNDPTYADQQAREVTASIDSYVIPTFATWGYAFRPSLASFASDDQISAYLARAVQNSNNKSVTAERCARNGIPCCRSWNGLNVDSGLYIGAASVVASGNGSAPVLRARAIQTGVVTFNEKSDALAAKLQSLASGDAATALRNSSAARLQLILDYEQKFINYFLARHRADAGTGYGPGEVYDGVKLDLAATRSADDILAEGNKTPVELVAIGYVLMTLYAVLVLANFSWPIGPRNIVFSNVGLGILGIAILCVGTIAGFGFMSWLRIELSPTTTNVLPFVTLGVGIDSVFIILSNLRPYPTLLGTTSAPVTTHSGADEGKTGTVDDTQPGQNLDCKEVGEENGDSIEKMRFSMARAGPSVILAAGALAVGFLAASGVRIPAVYTFAYQLSATVVINLILLLLIFVPVCGWNLRRIAHGRADLFPCISLQRRLPVARNEANADGNSRPVDFEDMTSRFASRVLGPKILFRSKAVAWTVIVASVLLTGGLIAVSAVLYRPGLPLSTVALRGTYQREYLDLQSKFFPIYVSYLVHKVKNRAQGVMPRVDVQRAMMDQVYAVQEADKTSSFPRMNEISWFFNASSSFLGYYNGRNKGASSSTPIPSEREYRKAFGDFITSSGASFLSDTSCSLRNNLSSDVSCDLRGGYPGDIELRVELLGSKMQFVQSGLVDTRDDFVRAITSTRNAVAAVNQVDSVLEAFVYGFIYEYWEQYVHIYNNLALILGLALLGVIVVAFIMLRSFRVTLIVAIVTVIILVQSFGICTAINAQVNAVSIMTYVIAIAMSVDFTAHYAQAYLRSDRISRRDRSIHAMTVMLGPSINEWLSSVVPLFVLLFSRFPFVRLYYWASWTIVVTLGFLNGMTLFPCALMLFGPEGDSPPNAEASSELLEESLTTHSA